MANQRRPPGGRKRTPAEDTATLSQLPRLDEQSVVYTLADVSKSTASPGGNLDSGLLPEIRAGIERYEPLEVLGEGGMGRVYLVYDRDLKRRLALKVMRDSDRVRIERFIEEAQVMGQLQHPNIVGVHEIGITGDRRLFYTMNEIRGQTLRSVIDSLKGKDNGRDQPTRPTYSLTRLMQVLQQMAHAIDYAHARGVVHRDLKPTNVMLGEHGEVQILDWGLAKLIGDHTEVDSDREERTADGLVIGTPAYMSPEQAEGKPVDPRSDIYALGIILYELLTLQRPFRGSSMSIIASHIRDSPAHPRMRSPGREIPIELERICLKALSKDPADRQQTGRELHDELQAWLESEADKSQRHRNCEQRIEQGRACLERFRQMRIELNELRGAAEAIAARTPTWTPVEDKSELFAARERVHITRDLCSRESARALALLTEAVGFENDNPHARELLADYFWDRFAEAEASQRLLDRDFFAGFVEKFHDGKYQRELTGDGVLRLVSKPEGADVWLHELVEQRLCMTLGKERRLGRTPTEVVSLPMGSYLAILRRRGYGEVRYPVYISRNKEWNGAVVLHRAGRTPPGLCLIPAGTFLCGGDPEARGWSLPAGEPFVDDFYLAEHPVTMAEYLEFLDDLAATDLNRALGHSPRRGPEGGSYLRVRDGRLELPEFDSEGDAWSPRLPVVAIAYPDVLAYIDWRSAKDSVRYRLATEVEWEKAARGVDGRLYPWGSQFDASLCNMRESRPQRPAPVTVDEFPADVSIYGVRGMAGNVREWTASEWREGETDKARVVQVVRGGAWNDYKEDLRSTIRSRMGLTRVNDNIGFRLALSPDDRVK